MAKMTLAQATDFIRSLARDDDLNLIFTRHASEQIRERSSVRAIKSGDILYLLKNGLIYDQPKPSTNPKLWKYKIEGITPNSEPRKIAAVVIPDEIGNTPRIKVITVMWVDGT